MDSAQMYWKRIHMLLKIDRSTNELPPLHDPFNNFNLAYDATQKSNVLNKYFCSITKLNDDDAMPSCQIFMTDVKILYPKLSLLNKK